MYAKARKDLDSYRYFAYKLDNTKAWTNARN